LFSIYSHRFSFRKCSFEALACLLESRHLRVQSFGCDGAFADTIAEASAKSLKNDGKRIFKKLKMNDGENDRIRFAEFELDKEHRRLYRDGNPVQLYAKAFDLLAFLIENNRSVVTKDELLTKVWPDQFVEEANLSVQISALRKALGESKSEPRFLVTVPGTGYKFVADIHSNAVEDLVIERNSLETIAAAGAETSEADLPRQPIGATGKLLFALAGLGALVVLGFFAYKFFAPGPRQIASLAVLPFENQDRDPNSEYLSEGLAESVIDSLSTSTDLRVMSRNSTFRFRGSDLDAKSIARELNVDAILTGRITTLGDNLSIRAELISADDNSVIWGEQFTRKLAEVERLQTDIARSIADKLRVRLTKGGKERLEKKQSSDAEAYRLYLLGRFHLNKFNDEGFFKGRDYFQQAIDKDPNYAQAYAGLGEAYNRLCGYNALRSSECFPKSRIAAEKAIELDDGLADAHATLASVRHFYDWDWPGADKEFKRALEIDPHNSYVHQLYSYYLTTMMRFDESLVHMTLAQELDPLSVEKVSGIGEIFFVQRRYNEAVAQYTKALEMDKDAGFVHWAIGNVYLHQGKLDEAIGEYEKSIPLSGNSPDERASLASAYALAGRKDEARKILEEMNQRSTRQYISPCVFAMIYGALGEKDEAFEWLEKAYDGRDFILTLLKVEPAFDPLRDDPRYAELERRVGFTQ
jgi:DNA-binding winged helix-turn-helix (wHTH) protein/TolB-like protein/Tfp pilus assembly protein PilF